MRELADYFNPINSNVLSKKYAEGCYGKIFQNQKIESQTQIALIGLEESRNACNGKFETGIDEIRSYFYSLSEIARINVVDFGNLKLGKQVKDTYSSIKYVTERLLSKNIIPVFFGASQDLAFPLAQAIHKNNSETSITFIDSKIDASNEELHSHSYIRMINKEMGKEIAISIVGYQTYFVPPHLLKQANIANWNLVRLGNVRNNYNQVEPIFRDSEMVSFDISSIRHSEAPAASFSSPNGFYADEACQLANLSGLSDNLKVFLLSEYQEKYDIQGQTAHLCAQVIWHVIYGVSQRKLDFPKKALTKYKKIYVKLEKIDMDIVFYENQENHRFWVEIPKGKDKVKVISCSELDYQNACNNEIPDRIWQNISRYLK